MLKAAESFLSTVRPGKTKAKRKLRKRYRLCLIRDQRADLNVHGNINVILSSVVRSLIGVKNQDLFNFRFNYSFQ